MRLPPTHPGEVFADLLEYTDYSQAEAARVMGLLPMYLNHIIKGRKPVSPATAVRFEKFTGMSAEFWLQMQTNYDLWHALRKIDVKDVPAAKKYAMTKAERSAK